MRVYLGGSINGKTDGECNNWRDEARALLGGCEFIDPMDRDYRGREDECYEEIVERDKEDIEAADVILANCWTPSWGTSMEIHYAHSIGKRVVVICDGRVSPWLRYHATEIHGDLASACASVVG